MGLNGTERVHLIVRLRNLKRAYAKMKEHPELLSVCENVKAEILELESILDGA